MESKSRAPTRRIVTDETRPAARRRRFAPHSPMPPAFVADLLILLHLGFILFVVLGGFLVLRWPRLAWVHLPAVCWAALIELSGRLICPLTPLEVALRHAAGGEGYEGGFIEHYVVPLIYPPGLTREIQVLLGILVLAINAIAYGIAWRRSVSGRMRAS